MIQTSNRAVGATAFVSPVILGMACDMVCLILDRHFGYFNGAENSVLFVSGRILTAALGGMLVGVLLFTDRGHELLDRLGF